MSASVSRAASKVAQAASKAGGKLSEAGAGKDGALKTGAKRDPELYVSRRSDEILVKIPH